MASKGSVETFDSDSSAGRLSEDIEQLAKFSLPGPGITRLSFTPEYRDALSYLSDEFEAVGFSTKLDPVGNFIATNVDSGERCVALGSHVDSVPHGGCFDGTIGVLCALEIARQIPDEPLKIFSFIEEEGGRFGSGLLGSRCIADAVSTEELKEYCDADGISFYEAAREEGRSPADVKKCSESLSGVDCYLEVHIEQGRVLEDAGEELGIVEAVAGVVHGTLEVKGRADHAGATPANLRSDAGLTAAEIVLELDAAIQEAGGSVVGTVGRINFYPGALNIIPGRATVSLDVRDVDEERRDSVLERITTFAEKRAGLREQQVSYTNHLSSSAIPMDSELVSALERATRRVDISARRMPSGAGHDAMIMARRVPSGMLFVPSRDGISHSPEEFSESHHVAGAVAVLLETLSERRNM